MSVDVLQDKIRKLKNPSMLELSMAPSDLPPGFCGEEEGAARGYGRFCRELLNGLKGMIPAVRVSFTSFALLGPEGLTEFSAVLKEAASLGYYVAVDAPQVLSVESAGAVAEAFFGADASYPCDGLIVPGYLGSDVVKPFVEAGKASKKDVFAVVRTANKSASEIQDLLSGSRLVHVAAADIMNRFSAENTGKSGFSRVGVMASASSADSLRTLRSKYPKLFLLLDGFDYPNSNAKNCSFAFDRFGHGAVAVAGTSITCAWKQVEASDGADFLIHAVAAAERMKKNLTRYFTVL